MSLGEGLTQQVARHIAGARFEQLSPQALRMTRLSLLDAVGVTLAASRLGEGVAAFADTVADTGGAAQASVAGFGFKSSILGAVLVNGAAAHALDFEDAYDGAPIHPNAACVPVALALTEYLDLSGQELLTALAIGCDLVCRLGLALKVNPDEAGWYPPPIFSTFGATAVAARLLGLNEDQTINALALALNQATATSQFKTAPGSTLRSVRDAFPAHAGLLAALLAKRGVLGFDAVFEGKAGLYALFAQGQYDPDIILSNLGSDFSGERLSFKPWPSCRGTHAFIEAALALQKEHGFSADEVETMVFTGGKVQQMLAEPAAQKSAPKTAIDAKFSLPFSTAAALVDGEVTLTTYGPDRLVDSKILALAARFSYVLDPAATLADAASGELGLILRSGRRLQRRVPHPLGAPQNPMSQDDIVAKFTACARLSRRALESEQVESLR
ncbi:MAG: MmgE/PrpD family protein, partial [Caulobacter sp.]